MRAKWIRKTEKNLATDKPVNPENLVADANADRAEFQSILDASIKAVNGKQSEGQLTSKTTLRYTRITTTPDKITEDIIEVTNHANPQVNHKHTYTLLAWGSGVFFMFVLLVLAVFIDEPKPFQIWVFASILALAGGAFATVISGLLDVKMKIGKQLAIGATGALAVFVLLLYSAPNM